MSGAADQLILSRKKVKISGTVTDTVMEDALKEYEVVSSPKDTEECRKLSFKEILNNKPIEHAPSPRMS